ncbi:MAG TPA: ComEC/Rec2 family competence protein [Myxococcota bacterium]|nr:ComEC/Rec2 family competence protein [Myxococcota bacterium]
MFAVWAGIAWAGTLEVHVLDVGQGDAILIEAPDGEHILVDSGTRSADLVPVLSALGVEDLDLVVATHPHADHIGGMQQIVRSFDVELFLDNGLEHTTKTYGELVQTLDEEAVTHRTAQKGEVFTYDDLTVTVLWPGPKTLRGTRSDLNSNSVVLRLDHGEVCFLLTGDAEAPTERALISGGIERCEVLKVAHHGSNHSTSAAFLRAVDPDIALISCGLGNRYHHPGDQTTARLAASGAVIYRTDAWGVLTLESDGRNVEVLDGLPSAANLGWLPRDATVAAPRPAIEPLPETAPKIAGSGGARPRTSDPDEIEPPRGLFWRIRQWWQRRSTRRDQTKE